MRTWIVTEADRTPEGKIRTLADLLPKLEEEETQQDERPRWKVGKLEAAGLVSGLLLAVALIAGMNVFLPARAPRLTRPTALPAATSAPTRTRTPTATATATPTPTSEPTATPEPPTAEVIYVPIEPPCDLAHPKFTVTIDLSPLGSATGVGCSQEEAQANAEAQAALVRAAFEPTKAP